LYAMLLHLSWIPVTRAIGSSAVGCCTRSSKQNSSLDWQQQNNQRKDGISARILVTTHPWELMEETAQQITRLLHAWRSGDSAALDQLMPIVYAQLHSIAARYMRRERSNHTLHPTALVNEAYLRLVGADVAWQDRVHFLSIAALTMRRILVDHAKAVHRVKRGSGAIIMPLEDAMANPALHVYADPVRIIDLDNALNLLARQDARKAQMLELIYFGGLSGEEAAEVLGVSVPTINRDLKLAKAWMRLQLQSSSEAK